MTVTFKTLVLDLDLKICAIDGKEVHLTRSEFLLLLFFLNHRNRIFSRQELLKSPDNTLRTIDTIISRLRKKLGHLGKFLITKPGFGYGLIDK